MRSTYYIILVTVVLFFFLLLYTRILGKKQMSHLTYFNYITGITLGSFAGNTIGVFVETLNDGIIAITIWVILTSIVGILVTKSVFLKILFGGNSTIVIKHGRVQYRALRSLRLNLNDLMMLLRENGAFSIKEVDYAILETNGRVSVLKKINKQTITKEELKIMTPIPRYMPSAIITDGKLIERNLKQLGLTKEWVLKQLKNVGIEKIKVIKFAEIQPDGSLYIDKKEKKE